MEFDVKYCNGFFEVKTSGDAEPGKFGDLLDVMLAHKKWKPGTSFLHDHTDLNSTPLSVNDVKDIAEMFAKRGGQFGGAKCALLVARDLEFGLVRMWDVFVEGRWDAIPKLFRSRDEAITWLTD